jgi:hypothetical protein
MSGCPITPEHGEDFGIYRIRCRPNDAITINQANHCEPGILRPKLSLSGLRNCFTGEYCALRQQQLLRRVSRAAAL